MSEQTQGWQPIETLSAEPWFGLVFSDGAMRTAYRNADGLWEGEMGVPLPAWFVPTHWMPLPEPPEDP